MRPLQLIALCAALYPALIAAAPPCAPPIFPGKWKFTKLDLTLTEEGEWTIGPAQSRLDGRINLAKMGAQESFIIVDCTGAFTGEMHETTDGRTVQTTTAAGFSVSALTTYTGERHSTLTGQVVNQGGQLQLVATSRVTSGYQTATYEGHQDTVDLAGQVSTLTLRIQSYDPVLGVITFDYRDNPWLRSYEQQANAISGGQVDFLYEGGIEMENRTPVVLSVLPDYSHIFIKNVDAPNKFVASLNWRANSGARSVEFKYGDEILPGIVTGDTAEIELDMGTTADSVQVTAIAGSDRSEPLVYPLIKIDIPAWAGGADITSAPGIDYSAQVDWPLTFDPISSLVGDPWIAGVAKIFGTAYTHANITASSSGTEVHDTFDAQFRFAVPLTDIDYTLNLRGTTSNTLTSAGWKMSGNATVRFPQVVFSKRFGLLDVAGPVGNAVCAASQTICDYVNSVGIDTRVFLRLRGTGTYSSAAQSIDWTGGAATFTVRAQASINVIPPPLDDLLTLQLMGYGAGCLTLQFYPDVEFKDPGVEIGGSVTYGTFLGTTTRSLSRGFGAVCQDAGLQFSPSSLPSRQALDVFPGDVRPSLAMRDDGTFAAAWAHPRSGADPQATDVRLRIASASTIRLNLTDDEQLDRTPVITFDQQGNLLVVWLRHPTPLPPDSSFESAGRAIELFYALVNPLTGALIASGPMTSDNAFDFGPQLVTGSGTVHLFWQSSTLGTLTGHGDDTLAFHHLAWNGTFWSQKTTLAANLRGVLGWRAAAHSSHGQLLVAATLDTDLQLATASDRQISLWHYDGSAWREPVLLGSSGPDSSPVPFFDSQGIPSLAWIGGNQLLGLQQNFGASPAIWLGDSEPLGNGFAHAVIHPYRNGLIAIWPGVNDLYFLQAATTAGGPLQFTRPQLLTTTLAFEQRATFAFLPSGAIHLGLSAIQPEVPLAQSGFFDTFTLDPITNPEDLDHDGHSGLEELFAGTSATDPQSHFRLTAITPAAGGLTLSWSSVPGQIYEVETSPDLQNWSLIGEVRASSTESSHLAAHHPGHYYFRLVVR